MKLQKLTFNQDYSGDSAQGNVKFLENEVTKAEFKIRQLFALSTNFQISSQIRQVLAKYTMFLGKLLFHRRYFLFDQSKKSKNPLILFRVF